MGRALDGLVLVEAVARVRPVSSAVVSPVVTVVVVGHSVRPELERCLGSVARHAGVPTEAIYVDNASRDGSADWVRGAYPDAQVVQLPQNRFGAARNAALPLSRGRHTLFLDSDAELTDGALPTLVDALDTHPGWGLVAPRLVHGDGRLQLSTRRFPPLPLPLLRRPPLERVFEHRRTVQRHLMADDGHARARPVLYAISACHLFRTELARRIGPLDERLAWGWEDADWCIRIRDAGADVVYLPEAVVVHGYRRLTRRRPLSRDALRQLGCHVHFQRKYRSRKGELLALQDRLDRESAERPAGEPVSAA